MIITFDLFLEKDLKAIREKELKEVAHNKSMTDDLTGVWNKRYLESRIYTLEKDTILALVDLDNLKAINDTYGHLAGDAILCHMSQTIQSKLGPEDALCRYGGDEFVVIFKKCDMECGVKIIESIRKFMSEEPIQFNGTLLNTSISAGLCKITNEIRGEKAIEIADQYLYVAMRKGKNRIEFEGIIR